MRWLVVLLLVTPAFAQTRVDVHLGGGMDTGTISGVGRPDAVGEAGLGLDHSFGSIGLGVILESVGRNNSEMPIAEELKLDLVVRYHFPKSRLERATLGFGAGIRYLTVEGDSDRPSSSIRGIDMLRVESEMEIANTRQFSLDFYIAWTIGYYSGEMRGMRYGDMPYPTQDVATLSSSFVLGLKTAYSL